MKFVNIFQVQKEKKVMTKH